MRNLFHPKESIYYICGSSGAFGKGILENKIYYLNWSCLKSLSNLWEESCEVVELVFVGFLLSGMSYHSCETTCWFLKKKTKSETNPLWAIEIKGLNVDVCKGFDEEVIFEVDLSIYVKPQQYTPIFVCSIVRIYTMEKIFPLSFGDKVTKWKKYPK